MAGDTYSFVIESFQEENVGRYTITAENQSGKATCSAEVLFEGTEFRQAEHDFFAGSTITNENEEQDQMVAERESSESSFIMHQQHKSTTGSKLQVKEKSQQQMGALNSQWGPPELERFSKEVHESTAPFVASAESHFSSANVGENSMSQSYSYTQQTVAYSNGASKNANNASNLIDNSASSFGQHQHQHAIDFSTTLIKDINQHYEPVELIINRNEQTVPSALVDCSSCSQMCMGHCHHHHMHGSHHHLHGSRELLNCRCGHEPVSVIIQKPLHHHHGGCCHHHRSGSLPPVASRLNFKSSGRSDFEENTAEFDALESTCCCACACVCTCADRSMWQHQHQHQQQHCHCMESSTSSHYLNREFENTARRSSKLSFKPVELVLDASSSNTTSNVYDYGKRYRDYSLPSLMSKRVKVPLKHENLIASSFIYDNNNNNNTTNTNINTFNDYEFEYDSQYSDFISDQREAAALNKEVKYSASRFAPYGTTTKSVFSSVEEREITSGGGARHKDQKLPAMEMTIDLKSPPTIDVPLRNINVNEGQTARLECTVNGTNAFISIYLHLFIFI
jgi:hypothetical protein